MAKEVRLGSAVLAKPVFVIIDLGDLWKVEGVECDGLVGYEMFRRFGVTIDYAGDTLTLAEPVRFTPPAGAASCRSSSTIAFRSWRARSMACRFA